MQHIDLKGKRIFITGAVGFIGANLVMNLLETVSPVTIIGIDNLNDYYDVFCCQKGTSLPSHSQTELVGTNGDNLNHYMVYSFH